MNKLCTYGAKIDCKDFKVILNDEKGRKIFFGGQREEKSYPLISAMKASMLLCQGSIRYWCYTMDVQEKGETTKDIPIVCEFKDIFPKELPRLPLKEILILR